ncbi:RagB/SusD family nutrient uptake outer membrane protein [Pedobacter sp. SD-b]|uniref:RagB/SusD family nutrient uptake outer membrane protein n=1 Tax=Pedobacter segetis TaxID=2793069 RepID=A0ABS1BFG2_9SPHI|nr:RagB/SusD family nutrient uptake outer membrane protein [Pedobacter segetis]MBK0381561.1 RagB/SusD family nutrient uptake outer membrane protein [Pedobacter segetis]
MIKYKYIGLFLLGATFTLSSCKNTLDLVPTDSFSNANAFRTTDDLQQGLNTAYNQFTAYSNNVYVSALISDEAKLGADNSGQGTLTYQYQYSADATTGGDVTNAWGGYYSLIDQANRILAATPAVAGDINVKNNIKAQLLGLRGISHFELLRMYSKNFSASDPLGVPYLTASNVLGKPSRNTQAEDMTMLEKDLADSYSLLPAVTTSNFTDTAINKVNIDAYRARISLYKGDYQKAIDYATTVINSGIRPISSGSAFQGIWTDSNNEEVLFRIRYANNTSFGSLFTTTSGNIYLAPSSKLTSLYATSDIRKATYIGSNGSGLPFVKKYEKSTARGGRAVDLKVIRISEMYLIRAEAYAKLTSPNVLLGAQDLNTVRKNRITGYTDQIYTDKDVLLADVIEERLKELAFEGQRFFDLKRNNLPVNRSTNDAAPSYLNLAANSYRFVLPIPSSEILANPNIVQNSGYNN